MKKLFFPFALILITFLVGCHSNNNRSQKTDKQFGEFVQAFTSGTISKESVITIYLAKPLAKIDVQGKKLFKFSPAIDGEVVLVGDRIIEFRPSGLLKSNTKYSAEFFLGKLLPVSKALQKMPFQFSTIAQSFSVSFSGLKNSSADAPGEMKFSGYLLTADVMDSEEAEKLLTATYGGEKREIAWQHDSGRRKHFFTIDALKRLNNKEATLKVEWNGSQVGIDNKGEKEIKVPALNSFEIINAQVIQIPKQHIQIRFSDNLLKNQNLEGLIQLEDKTKLKLEIDDNVINAWPDNQISGELNLTVYPGIQNWNYAKYKDSQNFLLHFSMQKPELRLIGKGVIVPQNNRLEFPFEAVGLHAVEMRVVQIFKDNALQFFQNNNFDGQQNLRTVGRMVYDKTIKLTAKKPDDFQQWKSYKINLASLFKIEQGAIYRVELRIKKEFSEFNCGDKKNKSELAETELPETEEYETDWDGPGWYSTYYYPPNYNWEERDNPCSDSYYNSDVFVSRNIFASKLGIIAKEGRNHTMYFVVTNLLTAEPEKGVQIRLYNYQNQLLETVQTNELGFAKLRMKKKPFSLIAQKMGQFGYLRLDDGNSLSTSNFNVAGQQVRNGIKGFIYAERGVWRPGDTLFVNFILEKKNTRLPENYPVLFQLINPNGQVVEKQLQSNNENGFYSFAPATAATAPTGNWHVEAKVGNVSFSKRVKIEAIKPNRLKVKLDFSAPVLTAKNRSVPFLATWLHGSPARSLKAKVDVLFAKDRTEFKGYEKFTFTNPASDFSPHEQTIFEGKLNDKGQATIPLDFQSLEAAPGMVKVWFTSRVFEEGGDFSTNVSNVKYAPFNSFVGVKMPESEDNWYKTDTDYLPEIVTVSANGKPVAGIDIEARLYKIDWRWWWESGSENLAHYISGSYYSPVQQWRIKNAQHLSKLKLNVKYNDWKDNGRYFLWVKDLTSGHATGTTFYMSEWGGWRSDEQSSGATMLTLKTDKEKYNVGDVIEVKIPSSKEGRALVSVENGTEVTDIFWVKTTDKQTTFNIQAKPEMAPNFYVHVTLIQKYGQTENDAPLRLYGVIPVMVENQETILHPQIKAPKEIEPEAKYTVSVSEKNGKEMTYTLAIVDEGLLGLTNYKTPAPHAAFYAREALGVKTWDLYDYVAGAYGAALEKAFAVGGDEELNARGKNKISRFKPVVKFAGPFTLQKGKTNHHNFTMPNYVGAVRIMVVAGKNGAYGKAEKTVPVRKGLMLLATLPRVLAPNEEVQLPVTVFAMKEKVKNVTVHIKCNKNITVVGEAKQAVSFSELGEKMAFFNLKVNSKTGVAKVFIEAKSGTEKATYEVELEVRNPNSKVTIDKSEMVEGEKTAEMKISLPGEPGTNKVWVEVSGFPSLNLEKHLNYLINYPHGCVEQVTSAAFPQLFLEKLTTITADQKLKIETNVRRTLERLSAFQLRNGGFAYWPGASKANEWGTNYAGHFLLKAADRGFTIPQGMKRSWLNYQKTTARNWSPANGYRNGVYSRNYDYTQAYRLYTLALAGEPDLGAMNRLREKEDKTAEVVWRLAAAYVLAGQPEAAEKMITRLSTEIKEYNEFGGTFGSALRDKAMILESLILLNKKERAFEMLKTVAADINRRSWLSTQTAAWCLMSAAYFADKYYANSEDTNFELIVNGKETKMRTKIPVVILPVKLSSEKEIEVRYTNKGKNATFVKLVASGTPAGTNTHSSAENLLMQTKYLDTNNREIDAASIAQGEDFKLVVTVKNPGQRTDYKEMVLSTVFPSGWEILNRRLNDIPENINSNFDYQDIRDDRVYTYFDLKMNEQKTFVFRLNATYVGNYYQPPVSCEAMYDFSVRAQKPGRWIVVKK